MKQIICDKCGKVIDDETINKIDDMFLGFADIGCELGYKINLDLCKKHLKELKIWLKSK